MRTKLLQYKLAAADVIREQQAKRHDEILGSMRAANSEMLAAASAAVDNAAAGAGAGAAASAGGGAASTGATGAAGADATDNTARSRNNAGSASDAVGGRRNGTKAGCKCIIS